MVSIIIPVYNGEKFLDECIRSVILQTIGHSEIELIMIDDCSKDNSLEIIISYKSRYPDLIKIITNNVNSQISKKQVRNIGVDYSTGEFIMFLDQDDWLETNALEILVNKMNHNKQIEYIEFSYNDRNEDGNIVQQKNVKKDGFNIYTLNDKKTKNKHVISRILPGYAPVWNKIYRKDFLIKNNIIHSEGEHKAGYSDNYFSGLLVLYCQKFATLNCRLYNYRKHLNNYTSEWKYQYERCKTGNFFYEACNERNLINQNKELVEFIFFKIYLLKTFWKLLLQTHIIPYEELRSIKNNVLSKVPSFRENIILSSLEETAIFFDILELEWSNSYLDQLRKNTLNNLEVLNQRNLYLT